ncbi:MAG: ATP-binding cassette domain-containing protein [Nitrospiraceae bacterium]|nr:ATP-binding cassette domain-containing protein [Nitrospiraceae bacterium]
MIHVEDLTRYYGDFCAVNQINFDIEKGEILGLLGPNGAGKTTTLRMLTGFIEPTSGTIRVKDTNIDESPFEIKKILGYLPESAPLYHDMLVYDYLTFVSAIRGIEKKRRSSQIHHLADLCSINKIMHKPIGELSKGYRQRVGLAHAMMSDPEILILDEPTSGLDPNQIVEIREIIRQIGEQKTVILSTHILSEAEATCNRIIIVNHGKIVADGSTESLKQSASGGHSIEISLQNADFGSVKERLMPIEGIEGISQLDGKGYLRLRLSCKSPSDIRGEIYKEIKKHDWVLLEFHQETRTLENIFRELTKEI